MTNKEAISNLNKLKSFHNGSYGLSIKIAKNAIEKQTLMKVKCYEDKFMHCPTCEEALGYKWEKYPEEKTDFKWLKYCWNCGQRLDWSEE